MMKRLFHDPGFVCAAALLLAVVLFVLLTTVLSPYSADLQDYRALNQPPGLRHFFGTDALGRDLMVRCAQGCGITLLIALISAALNAVFGALFGSFSACMGGTTDLLLFRFVEIINTVPGLLWLLLLSVILKPGFTAIILAIALTGWTTTAVMVRSAVLQIRQADYILALETMGARTGRIIFRHLLPNVASTIIVQMNIAVANAVFAEAFVSALGLGIQPPVASLGSLLNTGIPLIRNAPLQVAFPAALIFIILLSLNLLSGAIGKVLDA